MQTMPKKHMCRRLLPGLLGLVLCAPVPNTYAATVEAGFYPEGTALQLVLKTIEIAQQEIRLMGYSFTSLEVAGHLSGQNTGVSMWAWFWTGKLMTGRTTTPVKQP